MTDVNVTPVITTTLTISIASIFGALAFVYVDLVRLLSKTAPMTDRSFVKWLGS